MKTSDVPAPDRMAWPDQATAAIVLHGAGRRYEVGAGTVRALHDVDLVVGRGEFVVVLGPSGSGKTTLLNLIGALDVATEGTVVVGGQDLRSAGRSELARFRRRTVSFVFQTFNLFPTLTALENVQCGVEIAHGVRGARRRAAEVLARIGLGDRLDHYPAELSGGEQQRVAIARALATGNPILVADEPTGDLDFATGVQVLELLRQQAEGGHTVIVVTHNREISRIADRVIELSGGTVVRDGPPAGGRTPVAELRW